MSGAAKLQRPLSVAVRGGSPVQTRSLGEESDIESSEEGFISRMQRAWEEWYHRRGAIRRLVYICRQNFLWRVLCILGRIAINTVLVIFEKQTEAKAEEKEETDVSIQLMEFDLNDIFPRRNSALYYLSVEVALLLQCLYIALWATNFSVYAADSKYPAQWSIALVVPMLLNLYMLKYIIFTSCLLKSVVKLNRGVAEALCQEALEEQFVVDRFKDLLRNQLEKVLRMSTKEAFLYLREQFQLFDLWIPATTRATASSSGQNEGEVDGNEGVPRSASALKRLGTSRSEKDESQYFVDLVGLEQLLHSLKIFLTKNSLVRVFNFLDQDRSGHLSWDELANAVFPDVHLHKETRRLKIGTVKRKSFKYTPQGTGRSTAAAAQAHSTNKFVWNNQRRKASKSGDMLS